MLGLTCFTGKAGRNKSIVSYANSIEKPVFHLHVFPVVGYKDIAKKAGVSEMTVSRVMRGSSEVKSSTRKRVQEIAESMGYQRNPLVDSLMIQVRAKRVISDFHHIAWLFPDTGSGLNGLFHLYREGAEKRAKELGFKIDDFRVDDEYSPARVREILKARNIHGVLVNPSFNYEVDIVFDFRDFAVVTFGYSVCRTNMNRVTSHHTKNQYELLNRLRKMGYRDILYVSTRWLEERLNFGWLAPTLAFGKCVSADVKVWHMFIEDFEERLRSDPHKGWLPEVIVSHQTSIIDQLAEQGLSVPEDIGFVTTEAEKPDNRKADVTGMDQCSFAIGERAVEFLAELLAVNRLGLPQNPSALLVEGVWREGCTLNVKPNTRVIHRGQA